MKDLLKYLNVKEQESKQTLFLLFQSALIGILIAFYYTFSNGLFLKTFEIKFLPIAYIFSGLLGLLASFIFKFFLNKYQLKNVISSLYFLISILLFLFKFLINIYGNYDILVFLIFIFFLPISLTLSIAFSSVCNQVFDLRQGKRLFPIINSGEVVSSFIAFISISFILTLFNVPSDDTSILLYFSLVGSVVAFLFQFLTLDKFLINKMETSSNSKTEKLDLKTIYNNKYYRWLVILSAISMICFIIIDFSFLGIYKVSFSSQKELTTFFALFFGVVKFLEFIFKNFISGKLIDRYGLKFGISILPIILIPFTILTIAALLFETSKDTLLILFSMNMLLLILIKKSFDDPSYNLLFMPLPTKVKVKLQVVAAGKSRQIGIIFSGILLLILFSFFGASVLPSALFLIFLLVLWIWSVNNVNIEFKNIIYFFIKEEEKSLLDNSDLLFDTTPETFLDLAKTEKSDLIKNKFFNNNFNLKSTERIINSKVSFFKQLDESNYDNSITKTLEYLIEIIKSSKDFKPNDLSEIFNKLGQYNSFIDFQIINTLVVSNIKLKKDQRDKLINFLDNEIYFYSWLVNSIVNLDKASNKFDKLELLKELIDQERNKQKKKIMLVLALLYDKKQIKLIDAALDSNNNRNIVLAIEMLENIIDETYFGRVLPVIENDNITVCNEKLNKLYFHKDFVLNNFLTNLINQPINRLTPLIKALALNISSRIPINEKIQNVIFSNVLNPDFIIKSEAYRTIASIDKSKFDNYFSNEIDSFVKLYNTELNQTGYLERFIYLKKCFESHLFKYDSELFFISSESHYINDLKSDLIYLKENDVSLFIIDGSISVNNDTYKKGDVINLYDEFNFNKIDTSSSVTYLRIDKIKLFKIFNTNPFLIRFFVN